MKLNQTMIIREAARKLRDRYNPEYDVPAGPPVTWAEYDLMEMIERLVVVVEDLQDQINRINGMEGD